MSFGTYCLSPEDLAELIRKELIPMSRVLRHLHSNDKGSRARGRTMRTRAIKILLRRKAKKLGLHCFPNVYKGRKKRLGQWLWDLIWWNDNPGSNGVELAVESEWNRHPGEITDDFQKLLAVKSPLKLMIYQVSRRSRAAVRDAIDQCLRNYRHHVKGENYLFCEFQPDWSCECRLVRISRTGGLSNAKERELFRT